MSQRSVERVIGRLATDEGYRRRFVAHPEETLRESMEAGCDLTLCEQRALLALDADSIERFADAIDPRLQKCDCQGGTH